MFCPGETISHTFSVPFVPDDIEQVIVSYKQKDHVLFYENVTGGFEPVIAPDPDYDPTPGPEPIPTINILTVIAGAEVQGTKLVINPVPEPEPEPEPEPDPIPPGYMVAGSTFDVVLDQQESLQFKPGEYEIQLNVLTKTGDRFASDVMHSEAGEQHIRMVIPFE